MVVSETDNRTDPSEKMTPEWQKALKLLMELDNEVTYQYAMQLIENGKLPAPDEVGYELDSEEYGVLGFEAEMVWHEPKIAVLTNVDPDLVGEAEREFKKNGWSVYRIDESPQSMIQEFFNGGSHGQVSE